MFKSICNRKSRLFVLAGIIVLLSLAGYSVIAQTEGPAGNELEEVQVLRAEDGNLTAVPDRSVTYKPLYYFSGLLTQPGVKGTSIACTNIDPTNSIEMEVILYSHDGSWFVITWPTLTPLRTYRIESTQIPFHTEDNNLNSGWTVNQGFGKISANSKNLICTVQVLDAAQNPPRWMESLPIYGQGSCCSFLPVILN